VSSPRACLLFGLVLGAAGACASQLQEDNGPTGPGGEPRPALGLAAFTPPPPSFNQVQLEMLSRLIGVTQDNDPSKPDILMRRAGLHAAHARELRAAGNKPGSEQALLAGLADHLATLNFRSYPRADENLYEIVCLLSWAGREAQAREFLDRLATSHPQSRFLPDARLRFAELLYDERHFADAAKQYGQVLQAPRGRLSLFAAYRQAWSVAGANGGKGAYSLFRECAHALTPAGEDPTIDSRVRRECDRDGERLRVSY
jgi:hypothetical protein